MKRSILPLAVASVAFVSCEKKEPVSEVPQSAPVEIQTETPPPAAIAVEEQEFKIAEEEPSELDPSAAPSPTPGQRLDHAIERTEHGIDTARDKTEQGLRKAAEKTGNFLQRAGEAIERQAGE